jgi:glycosyltransferase involved in cell wall biosynthesis
MEKIGVVHHSNQLGLGGAEKTMQLFCKYLDKSIFDVHVMAPRYPASPFKLRLNELKALFGSKKARARKRQYEQNSSRVPELARLLGDSNLHLYTDNELPKRMRNISPHILHVHHSGEIEAPLDQYNAIADVPVIFTTNIFGLQGRSPEQERISKILFVSEWLKNVEASWAKDDIRCDVLYNPVEKPFTDDDLRSELDIPENTFVIGRIGRNADDIHDTISLKAYKELENDNTLFLVLSPPPIMIEEARELGIRNIRFLPPSTDDTFISRFYNTLDIFAHARFDGETFGCVIAEAMIHGKPVVTHHSHIRNSQSELVGATCGFVAARNDYNSYASFIKTVMADKELKLQLGADARKEALVNFEAEAVTKKLERFYFDALQKAGITV